MKIIRDLGVGPKLLNGLGVFVDNFVSSSGGAITFETHAAIVLMAFAFDVTDATVLTGVISSSTAYPGTQKVTFTAVSGKVYQCLVITSDGYSTTLGTVSTTGTIDDVEVY